jgi:hypothetical protein
MTATGRGAQAGVLIKDAEALERFAAVDTLIVDKTGTLTEGRPKLTDAVTASKALTKRVCCYSPVRLNAVPSIRWPRRSSRAPNSAAQNFCATSGFEAATGKGVSGVVDGQKRLARQCRDDGRSWRLLRQPFIAGGRHARARARRRCLSPSTASLRASSRWPIRSRRQRQRQSAHFTTRASLSSWRLATMNAPPRRSPQNLASTRCAPTCCPTPS